MKCSGQADGTKDGMNYADSISAYGLAGITVS